MSGGAADGLAVRGTLEPSLEREFPGLELRWLPVRTRLGPSPPALRQRLRELSSRFGGGRVVAMRTQPVAHAYRSFYRQIGLDPDVTRIPSEAAAVARLLHGGFRSRDLLSDALLVSLVETGVGVWGLAGERVQPETLGLRTSRTGDRLGEDELAPALPAGRLVVADAGAVHALLFEAPVAGHGPRRDGTEVVLFAIGVPGVPSLYLEEALWLAAELLEPGSPAD